MDADRKNARAAWPVTKVTLSHRCDDLSATTTHEERIAMMWPLALESFRLAGIEVPTYDRAHTPTRLIRR